jgi:hypothetical protein
MKIKFGYIYNAPQGLRLTDAYSSLKMITVIAVGSHSVKPIKKIIQNGNKCQQ